MEAAQDMAAINSEAAFQPSVVDAYIPEEGKPVEKANRETTNTSMQDLPLTIESVTNSFANRRKSKLTTQVFFTPTVSYRKLSENKSYMRTLLPQGGGQMEPSVIQDSVTHRPNIGFEVGLAVKYPLSRNLKIRGGVQFNMNRYDIKAFHYTTEIATIALNVGNRVDSVVKATNYRNQNGFRTNWLQNFYFQVSTPIGIEYLISNKPDRQFGIATSIQPTYVIGDRAYLISTDYKNYAQVPSLIRRWNVATNFEAFMSYSTGQLNWQVGPQVRYQLLSSFMDKYPVKENLFDFGLKVGISLNKNK
jgi:hypothetical protein